MSQADDNHAADGLATDEYIERILRTIEKAPEWAASEGKDPRQAQLDQLRELLGRVYATARTAEYQNSGASYRNPYTGTIVD